MRRTGWLPEPSGKPETDGLPRLQGGFQGAPRTLSWSFRRNLPGEGGAKDDEAIKVLGRPQGVHSEAGRPLSLQSHRPRTDWSTRRKLRFGLVKAEAMRVLPEHPGKKRRDIHLVTARSSAEMRTENHPGVRILPLRRPPRSYLARGPSGPKRPPCAQHPSTPVWKHSLAPGGVARCSRPYRTDARFRPGEAIRFHAPLTARRCSAADRTNGVPSAGPP